jgi:hypothetical protein
MFTPLEIMARCPEAGLNFRVIPVVVNAPLEFLTGFTEGILLGRLIRSLEDRHSMVPGRLFQLWFKALFEKRKGFLLVLIHENSGEPQSFLGMKVQDHAFYDHLPSFYDMSFTMKA